MKAVLRFLFTCTLLFLPLVGVACDGFISVNGTVYEWVNPPPGATGEIYIDINGPVDRILKPIQGATITIQQYPTSSNTSGKFYFSTVTGPGRWMADIKAEKTGYYSLNGSFQHGGVSIAQTRHQATIFLVKGN